MISPTTRNGTRISIVEVADQACGGCDHLAQLALGVRPPGAEDAEWIPICADCIAGALAIHLGRAHVDAGGAVEDLQVPETPTPWRQANCLRSPTGMHQLSLDPRDLSCVYCGAPTDDGS